MNLEDQLSLDINSEMLPMAFPVPMPYCAVISCRRQEEEGVLIVNKNSCELASFINHLL